MIFSSDWPVTTDGSDSQGRITLPYLSGLLQESATLHANQLGWGYDDLAIEGLQWVLSRQWLEMKRYPGRQDTITIKTWPSGRGGLTWLRDYRIIAADGEELGQATSLWFLMDQETRRPRPANIGKNIDFDNAERVRPSDLKPIPAISDRRLAGRIKAGYFDIDVHNHVNNVRYLTWMLGAVEPEFHNRFIVRELEINFLAEGFLGDELDINISETGKDISHGLIRHKDGIELSRMKTRWAEEPGT
jgi:medium-chain acyl-[acyl-carrier-protein] hydrolase